MATRNSILKKGNNRFRKLIQKEILRQNAIITGDMYRSIEPIFKEDGDNVKITLSAIYYYKYVDEGTKRIRARLITDNVLQSPEFNNLLNDIMVQWLELEVEKVYKRIDKNFRKGR